MQGEASASSASATPPGPAAADAATAAIAAVRTACRADMEKLCASVEREGRRACLETTKDKLSDGCKAARQAASAAGASGGGGSRKGAPQ